MKITKVPSWLIILICLLIGIFASYQAKQQLTKLEYQLWQDAAAKVNTRFLTRVERDFANKSKLIYDFSALAITNQNFTDDSLDRYVTAYLQTHPELDEVSLGYYQIDDNRLSHQWSFGSAQALLEDNLKAQVLSLYSNSKTRPNQLTYQSIQMQDASQPDLLAGLFFPYQGKSYLILSVIDLNSFYFALDKLSVPDDFLMSLSFHNHKQESVFEWSFNQALRSTPTEPLASIKHANWQLSSRVSQSFMQGVETEKSDNIFIAGTILSLLIAVFISFLAWLRYLSKQEVQSSQLELSTCKTTLLNSQEHLKRSAKLAVYSQLAPKVTQAIPPYISNVIKACSSLEEKGIHFKNLIKEKKATKSQYLSFLDNTVMLARGSAESMLKAGNSLYNLEKIKQELESNSVRQIHVQSHIQDLVDTYKGMHKQVNFIITVTPDLTLECDPGTFTQLLSIFITNSLEHGFKQKADQVLMIDASFNKRKNRVSLRIEDNGCGLEPELLEAINQDQTPDSVGIGLSLAKEIINTQLSGEIDIKSKLKRYTRISLLLPKTQADVKTQQADEQPPGL